MESDDPNNNHDDTEQQQLQQDRRRRRRSSLLLDVKQKLHSHFMSTLALCSSVLTMFYLVMSVFPYSGFMVIHLVDGVNNENAGLYAGVLTSSFSTLKINLCSTSVWRQHAIPLSGEALSLAKLGLTILPILI